MFYKFNSANRCKYIHFVPIFYPFWGLQPITKAWINKLKWADVVICAPGGICMGGFMNWSHINFLRIAQYYHKPIIYFCRSIGPFSEENKEKKVFKRWKISRIRSAGNCKKCPLKKRIFQRTLFAVASGPNPRNFPVNKWVAKIIDLAENPKLRTYIGDNAHETIQNGFTWEKLAPKFIEIYKNKTMP